MPHSHASFLRGQLLQVGRFSLPVGLVREDVSSRWTNVRVRKRLTLLAATPTVPASKTSPDALRVAHIMHRSSRWPWHAGCAGLGKTCRFRQGEW